MRVIPVGNKRKKEKYFKLAKGYYSNLKNRWRLTKQQVERSLTYSYIHRRQKRRFFRKWWITRISAILKAKNMSYSKFIKSLKDRNIILDRKILAYIAANHPQVFQKLLEV